MTKTLIVGLRAGRPEHTTEAEGVIVDVVGRDVILRLDDGETLTLEHSELLGALGVSPALVGLRAA